jgi:hypothetical protein
MARTVHFVLLVADVLSGSAASAVATASRQNSMQLHALAQFPIPKAVAGGAPRRRRSAGGHPLFPLRHTRRTSAARAHRRSLPRGAPLLSNNIARPRRDSDATPPARFDGLAPCGGAVGLGRGQAARGTVDWSSYYAQQSFFSRGYLVPV